MTSPVAGMPLAAKRDQLVAQLKMLDDPQERLSHLIDQARKLPSLPAHHKTDAFRVEGCLSNLWFVPSFNDGLCWFRADSDSMVVRAIAMVLCEFYSGATPRDVLQIDPSFLAQAGITQHLSMNRRNGLSRLWDKIRGFAEDQARRP